MKSRRNRKNLSVNKKDLSNLHSKTKRKKKERSKLKQIDNVVNTETK